MNSICLVMIVRDEAAVIRRCLDSVRGIIDHWVICDTGSTDGTPDLICQVLQGIPGELHEVPWVDFGHNRSLALKLARGKADYHLLIDADMTVEAKGDFRTGLTADAYLIRHDGELDYAVERLVSDRHEWRYVGRTHESIAATSAKTWEELPSLRVAHHKDGSSWAVKYMRDIELLRRDLEEDPNNSRAVFYLAQTYRDLGNLPQALEWYEKRAGMGGWEEEVWYAVYQVARLQHRMGVAWPLVLGIYLSAYEERPTRAEPLYWIARAYRESGQPRTALLFVEAGLRLPYPDDQLFIEREIYESGLESERCACLSSSGGEDPETTECPD